MTERTEKIRSCLEQSLAPTLLEIIDDSKSHEGHAGQKQTGGGHFSLTVVSAAFTGKSSVQRHQMIYRALGPLMQTDIHALSIRAMDPLEQHP
ncbi:MAG: BolA family protein [Methylococcaceae bacterium]